MKHCLNCKENFNSHSWNCPSCNSHPENIKGITAFSPDLAHSVIGFDSKTYGAIIQAENNGHFWLRARQELLLWAMKKYFPHSQSFFEVGCGSGYMLSGLNSQIPNLSLTGSEVLIDGLHHAAQRVEESIQLFQMDARHLPFSEEFDVIGSFDVLEHIAEDELA